MASLHELLDANEAKLLDGWMRATAPAEGATAEGSHARVAHEGLSAFLGQLKMALRAASVAGATPPEVKGPESAEPERDLGLDTLSATRVYGLMQALILGIAAESSVEVKLAEQLALASQVNASIARAAAVTQRKHRHELYRVAHQLRNPLGSAIMAMTLLRSKTDLGENARLADLVERNLQRLQGLIEEAVERPER